MRTGDNRVATVIDLYHRELADRFPVGEVKAIIRTVFADRLGWDAMDIELRKQEALSESELLEVYLPLKRIRSGEPLQYILGRTNCVSRIKDIKEYDCYSGIIDGCRAAAEVLSVEELEALSNKKRRARLAAIRDATGKFS